MMHSLAAAMAVLAMAAVAVAQGAAPPPPPPAADAPAGQVAFPTFGLAVVPPPGWARTVEGGMSHVAGWSRPGEAGAPAEGLLTIQIEPGMGRQPRALAEQVAKALGGAVAPSALLIDGAPAWVAAPGQHPETMHPQALAVVGQGAMIYLFSLAGAGPPRHRDQFEALAQGVTWQAIEPPTQHLELSDEPVLIFDGAATLKLPALARPIPVRDPQRSAGFAIFNYRTPALEHAISLTRRSLGAAQHFEQFRDDFAQLQAARPELKTPFRWRELGADRCISEPLRIEAPARGDQPQRRETVRVALVRYGGHQALEITFACPDGAADTQPAYWRMADQVLRSVSAPPF